MKHASRLMVAVGCAMLMSVFTAGCDSDKKDSGEPPALTYVGSETCSDVGCHADIYADFIKSGHPYKLQELNGVAPTFPAGTSAGVPNPPPGTSWTDFDWIIGGYGGRPGL